MRDSPHRHVGLALQALGGEFLSAPHAGLENAPFLSRALRHGSTRYLDAVEVLADKLGSILFQLPPNWELDSERLRSFLEMIRDMRLLTRFCLKELISSRG